MSLSLEHAMASDKGAKNKGNQPRIDTPSADPLSQLLSHGHLWLGEAQLDQHPSAGSWTLPSKHSTSNSGAIPFNAHEIDSLLPHGGLKCGGTHEFFYNDPLLASRSRTEQNLLFPSSIPALLARNAIEHYYSSPASAWHRSNVRSEHAALAPFFIIWIGKRCWPTPFALPTEALPCCLFIDPATEKLALWAIETALRSHAVKIVIADCPSHSLTTSRRFLLAAEAHNTTAILLRSPKEIAVSSSATTKWQISPALSEHSHPLWEINLARCKGRALAATTWLVGLEDNYENRAEVSLRVFPRMVNRSYQTEATGSYKYGT